MTKGGTGRDCGGETKGLAADVVVSRVRLAEELVM
jgi:hypothetical protein